MEGKKYDGDKPSMYLLPPKATLEVARVLTYGAAKYDEENWKKLDNLQNRYTGAALRHLFSHMDGEVVDPETDLNHLAHAICCLMFKLEDHLSKKENKGYSVAYVEKPLDGKYSVKYDESPPTFTLDLEFNS